MRSRNVFCNRTLNLRSIKAIGYDMDYTLIHYHVNQWERRAYEYLKEAFKKAGWPVDNCEFDPHLVCRGLIIDIELGNIVKSNRFGFVKQAIHGSKSLDFDSQRTAYSRTIVDLSEARWVFLNTLFSISEGCIYAQLVDLLDQKKLPAVLGYRDLYFKVRDAMNHAHMEGRLKADIIGNPDRFVDLDEDIPRALLDQKDAGKKLLLITNSEWTYTQPMMQYAFDRFLPQGLHWQDLFDVIIVGARKPDFFTQDNPLFEIATPEGLLSPSFTQLRTGATYFGGSARQVEKHLGISGDEILYVGDHMFGDVRVTKDVLRWRTALIMRELEDEIKAHDAFLSHEQKLSELMTRKEKIESESCQFRLSLQRLKHKRSPQNSKEKLPEAELHKRLQTNRDKLDALDKELQPYAKESAELSNHRWGLLMRAGNDKSHLAYQIERYADIYTSRVSNFMHATPFVYLRSSRGVSAHDTQL